MYVSPPFTTTAGGTTTYNATLNITEYYSTDSAIDSVTASTTGISVAGWAVWPDPGQIATSVGVSVKIGSTAHTLTANQLSSEAQSEEESNWGEDVGVFHGYTGTFAVAPGSYNVCISVYEPIGNLAQIGCQTVVVPAGTPTVYGFDSIQPSGAGISVAGWAEFPDAPATPVGVAVNIGSNWYAFTANQPNSDAGAGTNHGYSGTIPLAPGTYQACIWVTEPGGAAINTGCHSVTVPAPAPTTFGLDTESGAAGGITVAGWAQFPGSPSTSVGVAVNIGSSWYGLSANQANTDAGAGTNHGYSTTIALAPGSYNVCIWVAEPTGAAVNTGCHVVVVPARPATTFGLDSITGAAGGITATGWAQFPDAPATAVGVAVNIGSSWYGFSANQANADAGAGTNHGYTATIPLAPGSYNACIWVAEPTGAAVNTGCHTVIVPARPATTFGLDSISGAAGGITATGWAQFPDAPSTAVGVAVNVGSSWYGFTANQANGDAGAGTNHGYVATVPLAPGTYNACIWVTEPVGAAVNTGCHTVVVPQRPATVYGFDSATGSAAGVTVTGWAQFPDALTTPVGVAVNIGSGWYGFTANQVNTDAGAGTNHGYSGTIPLPAGTYSACIWMTEATGPAVNTGCHTVVVPPAAPAVASFETATAVTGGIQVTGYSVFPGSLSSAVGVAANVGSTWLAFTANQTDAAAATLYPSSPISHGFIGFIPEPHGTYSVCMWTLEPGSAPSANFGCKPVTVP
jgi:hypothetical protein